MKNVKIFFAAISLSLLFANSIQAQGKTLSKEKNEEIANQYKENQARLALTSEQQEPYRTIAKKYAGKMRELRENQADKSQKLEAFKAIIAEKNIEMKALLLPEQYKIYLDIQEERKEKMLEIINR